MLTVNVFLINNVQINKGLKDKIVLIENADPGFDFIFSYNIKGLITKYGGANSHMAIRCLELNIPAIIGLGTRDFDKVKNMKTIEYDCEQKTVR